MQGRVDDNCRRDPPAVAEPARARRRTWPIWFALAFGLVPNGIAVLIHCLYQSHLAWVYCHTLPALPMNIGTGASSVEVTGGVPVNILVDALVAYLLTAVKGRWLGLRLGILAAYVVASRFIVLYLVGIAMGLG